MEIVRPGELKKQKWQVTCDCGCVVNIPKSEAVYKFSQYNSRHYGYTCPTCKHDVTYSSCYANTKEVD